QVCGVRCRRGTRCRRRRCRRRRPSRARRAYRGAPVPSRRAIVLGSFLPAFVLLVLFVVTVFRVGVVVVEVVVLFLLLLLFLGRDVELDGRQAHHLEIGATLRATELVALVDVELVDFYFGIAFGTGGHTGLRSLRIPPGGTIASIAISCANLQCSLTPELRFPIAVTMTTTSVDTKTVVVADDTPFVRARFRVSIENAGHKAIVVKSAAELLARVRADLDRIDLIIVDLRLPHAPGVDLVRSIRKLDDGRLPVLIFSGTIA